MEMVKSVLVLIELASFPKYRISKLFFGAKNTTELAIKLGR